MCIVTTIIKLLYTGYWQCTIHEFNSYFRFFTRVIKKYIFYISSLTTNADNVKKRRFMVIQERNMLFIELVWSLQKQTHSKTNLILPNVKLSIQVIIKYTQKVREQNKIFKISSVIGRKKPRIWRSRFSRHDALFIIQLCNIVFICLLIKKNVVLHKKT